MRRIFAVLRGGEMPSLGLDIFPAYMVVKMPFRGRKKVLASGMCVSPPRTAKICLLRPEDISCMEECKIQVWEREKKCQPQQGSFPIPRTANFQRRALF